MEKLRKLIKEVLSTPPTKKDCNCGCHSCDNVGNPGVVLNESVAPKQILSENLRYHVENKLPLTENTFRYGSQAFLNLWAEARSLYLREIIHVNEDDKQILLETHLGNYGIYENVEVPLDLPMEDVDWPQEVPSRHGDIIFKLVKVMPDRAKYELIDAETGKVFELGGRVFNNVDQLYKSAEDTIKPQGDRQSTYLGEAIIKGDFVIVNDEGKYLKNYRKGGKGSTHYSPTPLEWTSNKNEAIVFGTKGSASNIIRMLPSQTQRKLNIKALEVVNESSKKKNPPLNKPKRGGSKAYYVYVKDPKTKRIKKVSFGSGGLKAKINNPKARQAFAKRHRCSEKTDKTKASYWSCRLPRYASLLGIKSSFSGFW